MSRFINSFQEGIIKDIYSSNLRQFKCDGKLTAVIRKMLQEKRADLFVSCLQLSHVLGITSQTIHNWESGLVKRCCGNRRYLLLRFLQGEFDEDCKRIITTGYLHSQPEDITKRFQNAIERVNNAMTLCRQHNQLREQLIQDIDHSANKVLLAILNNSHQGDID